MIQRVHRSLNSASLSITSVAEERSSYLNLASTGASDSVATLILMFVIQLMFSGYVEGRHAFRSRIWLRAFYYAPKNSIKCILTRGINPLEIQLERSLRIRPLCRVQLIKSLLRFQSRVRS